jgi:hypothetical protein
MKKLTLTAVLCALAGSLPAADFSFAGMFTADNNVQPFEFTVGSTSTITLRSWSYAGGTNAAGDLIARGGFDPILALFSGTGSAAVFVNQNDDGGCGLVAADSGTGECWDTFFSATVGPGTYTATVMQYDNFANGPTLGAGFLHDGNGNFTASFGCSQGFFCDVSDVDPFNNRDSHWAFDILNVESAVVVGSPEPATMLLLGGSLVLLGGLKLRKRA